MKICLLNGNPDSSNDIFENNLQKIRQFFETHHEVEYFMLRDMEVKSCTGCFGCWVKKPGECVFEDDSIAIRKAAINTDLLLFASPLIMGFPSALLKVVQDKMLPLLLPYIDLIDKECHHQRRYEQYPDIGLLYTNMKDADDEEIAIVKEIYDRFAINFHSHVKVFENIENNPEEIAHALNAN